MKLAAALFLLALPFSSLSSPAGPQKCPANPERALFSHRSTRCSRKTCSGTKKEPRDVTVAPTSTAPDILASRDLLPWHRIFPWRNKNYVFGRLSRPWAETKNAEDVWVPMAMRHARSLQIEPPSLDPVKQSPTSMFVRWGDAPEVVAIPGLYGCTVIVLVSRCGIWLSHFWEDEIDDVRRDENVARWENGGVRARTSSKYPVSQPFSIMISSLTCLLHIIVEGSSPAPFRMTPWLKQNVLNPGCFAGPDVAANPLSRSNLIRSLIASTQLSYPPPDRTIFLSLKDLLIEQPACFNPEHHPQALIVSPGNRDGFTSSEQAVLAFARTIRNMVGIEARLVPYHLNYDGCPSDVAENSRDPRGKLVVTFSPNTRALSGNTHAYQAWMPDTHRHHPLLADAWKRRRPA